MSEKVYRTAIYARLSKDDGDKVESNSITSQKAMCEEYISRHGDLELVETFVDDGYSGVDFNRPGFRRLEEALRDGRVEVVLCKDLSRFSRNYIESGRYLERIFPQLGVRFIAINDGYDSLTGNAQSDSFVIPFKNLINDTYCKDISVKIRTNLDVKRRRGEYVGAYAPYGYQKDPDDKNRLVVDEYAGDIVRQIYSMYKDGISICRIAEKLDSLGVLSPMEYKISMGSNYSSSFRMNESAKWSYTAVHRILTNEVYIGILAQGKRGTPNYKVHVVQDKDESEWIKVEGAHEALITYEDFMSVRRMLGRDTRSAGEDSEENMLSGFLFCGDCGQPMTRKVVPAKNRKYYYYICSTHKRHEGCTTHSISAKEVLDSVTNAVKQQIENVLELSETLEYISSLPTADRIMLDYEVQMEKLTEEITYYKKLKLGLYEDLKGHIINKDEYVDFRERYTLRIEEKSEALERVRRESRVASANGSAEKIWVALFRKHENIGELSRRTLMALVDKIMIYEGHVVEVLFQYGDEYRQALEIAGKSAEKLPLAV